MADEKMFLEAKQAIEEGHKDRARDLLTRLLKVDQKNVDYWLYMSAVVESTSEKIFCLESVLRADPQNLTAWRGLVLLGARSPDERIVPVPVEKRKWVLGTEIEEEKPKGLFARLMSNPISRVITFLSALIILGGLIWLSINNLMPERKSVTFIQVSTTPKSIEALLPSKTPTKPSPTALVRSPTPTYLGSTPLWMLLEATYTPTPRYINTPHPIYEAYRTGMRAYDRQDYPSMINYMRQAARDDPNSPDLHYYLGEAYRLNGNYEDALKSYQQAIDVNANFGPAYLRRAQMVLLADPTAEVIQDFLKVIELDPDYMEGYLELAAYDLSQGNYEAALEDLKTVEEKAPYEPRLYLIKSQVLLKQGEYAAALEFAQKAYEMDQTELPIYRALAEASYYNEKTKEAQRLIEIYLLFEKEDPQAWLIYGLSAFHNGDRETAFEAMDQALQLDDRLPEAYRYRGLLYLEAGEGQSAVNDLIEAARFLPNDFEINLELGRALLAAERYMDAYKQLNSTQNLAETDPQRAEVFYWRGRTLEAGGNPIVAEVDYLALLALPSEAVPPEYIAFAKARLVAIKSPTPTATATSTSTLTPTATATPTRTPTRTPTLTATPKPSITPTASRTAALTQTPVRTPTKTVVRTNTRTPTQNATRTPTRTP